MFSYVSMCEVRAVRREGGRLGDGKRSLVLHCSTGAHVKCGVVRILHVKMEYLQPIPLVVELSHLLETMCYWHTS